MSPFATALTRWVETLANQSARLDSMTRVRLSTLSGHRIAIEIDPAGDAVTLHFENDSIRLSNGVAEAPSVIVRGTPIALATAFLGVDSGRSHLTIDGDEVVLSQFRSIVRDFRPDVFSPLENLVGKQTADSITNIVEFGFNALAAIGRGLGEEGSRLARESAGQRYLTATEFDAFLESILALGVRVDRLAARTDAVESSAGVRS